MDIRTPYVGEFDYNNARLLGIQFLRGKPAKIKKANDTLVIQVEDTLENDLVFLESDIVVLSIGGVPDPTTAFFKDKLNIELADSGFFHIAKGTVGTNVEGVFVAGAASGLKDIAYSMAQGSCAAAKVDITLKFAGV
jgi:heterodisulfide reductase subunit A